MNTSDSNIGARLRILRQRSNISMRQLARMSELSVSYISLIEKDQASPTLAAMRRILTALGTDFISFFGDNSGKNSGNIFRKSEMQTVTGKDREYTLVLPAREDIHIEMMDENYFHRPELPEYETMENEFSGYVISGTIEIEINDETPVTLTSGDAFHVPRGAKLRGYCHPGSGARILTVAIR